MKQKIVSFITNQGKDHVKDTVSSIATTIAIKVILTVFIITLIVSGGCVATSSLLDTKTEVTK
jgi:hypothetical protein